MSVLVLTVARASVPESILTSVLTRVLASVLTRLLASVLVSLRVSVPLSVLSSVRVSVFVSVLLVKLHSCAFCTLCLKQLLCSTRGAAGPLPDVVPLLQLPGRVPAEGVGLPGAAAAGPVCRLRPGVLLCLQGKLAPWPGLPGEQPAHHLLPPWREQVRPRVQVTESRGRV